MNRITTAICGDNNSNIRLAVTKIAKQLVVRTRQQSRHSNRMIIIKATINRTVAPTSGIKCSSSDWWQQKWQQLTGFSNKNLSNCR